jgi:hypothetical protein
MLCVGSWLGGTWWFFLLVWRVRGSIVDFLVGREGGVCVCVVSSKGMRLKGQEGGIVGLRTT